MAQVLEPQRDPLEGRTIAGGKYRLERFRAADELGRLYLGRHVALERPLSIKVLHGSYLTDEQLVQRFERAGLAASRVRHPNVVDVVDLGRESTDGLLYLVQEYIEGRTLEEIVAQEGPLEARRVADIGMQIAQALGAAHAGGVIHRDVKPANVVVLDREGDDGELQEVVKVLDFGVAKLQEPLADQPKHMTIAMVSGTPEYMSPEHCNGLALDARSDLYALGCVLYFLSTGTPPFTGDGHLDVLLKQTREAVRPPSALRPEMPANLEAVILKLLAKRPDDRYPTARAARAAFRKLVLPRTDAGSFSIDIDGEAMEHEAAPMMSERRKQTVMLTPEELGAVRESSPPKKRGTRLMIAAIVVAIVTGVLAGLFFGQLYQPSETERPSAPG